MIEMRQMTQGEHTWLEFRYQNLTTQRGFDFNIYPAWGDWSEWQQVPQVTIEIEAGRAALEAQHD